MKKEEENLCQRKQNEKGKRGHRKKKEGDREIEKEKMIMTERRTQRRNVILHT